MSRKEQFDDKVSNPASLTIQWAGGADAGHLKAYDPEAKEKVKLGNMSFVVLKERNCLDGFSSAKNTGAWSNEIVDMKKEPLTVMYKDNGNFRVLKEGMYEDIKPEMESQGVKYHKAIYAMVVDSPDIEAGTVVRILLKGAGVGAWFQIEDKDKKGTIALTGFTDEQNGAVKYRVPVFTTSDASEDMDALAESAFDKVDAYLKSRTVDRTPPQEMASVVANQATDTDDIPF